MFLAVFPPSGPRTVVLAHNNSPPIGANIMPTAKKIGRTVLGVRIGLRFVSIKTVLVDDWTHCHAFRRCCRKAVSEWCQ